uniref:Rab3-GAP regulatory subunit N-terminal domain-containing protein n=1 Tax=Araucaria cunninghamii TaxID=56994 RepID=A0A0D6R9I0_ARACU
MEVPLNADKSSTDAVGYGKLKHDFCLCLAIHAPRRGVVEVWKMRTGPRIMTLKCAKGCQLLQPACKLTCLSSDTSDYIPSQVYLLNGDSGLIAVLNPTMQPTSN